MARRLHHGPAFDARAHARGHDMRIFPRLKRSSRAAAARRIDAHSDYRATSARVKRMMLRFEIRLARAISPASRQRQPQCYRISCRATCRRVSGLASRLRYHRRHYRRCLRYRRLLPVRRASGTPPRHDSRGLRLRLPSGLKIATAHQPVARLVTARSASASIWPARQRRRLRAAYARRARNY